MQPPFWLKVAQAFQRNGRARVRAARPRVHEFTPTPRFDVLPGSTDAGRSAVATGPALRPGAGHHLRPAHHEKAFFRRDRPPRQRPPPPRCRPTWASSRPGTLRDAAVPRTCGPGPSPYWAPACGFRPARRDAKQRSSFPYAGDLFPASSIAGAAIRRPTGKSALEVALKLGRVTRSGAAVAAVTLESCF